MSVSGLRLPTVFVVGKREQYKCCAGRAQKAPLSAPLMQLPSLSPLVALASDADCSDQKAVPREVQKRKKNPNSLPKPPRKSVLI